MMDCRQKGESNLAALGFPSTPSVKPRRGAVTITDSHYNFLGLPASASTRDISEAVERISKQANALANVSSEQSRELRDRIRQIKLDLLTSDERRSAYDAMLTHPQQPVNTLPTTGSTVPVPSGQSGLNISTMVKTMPLADRLIGGSLVIIFLDLFLPWSPGVTAFEGWGIIFFLVWIALMAFFVQREFLRERIILAPIPWPDWGVELLGSSVMLLCLILYLIGLQGTPGFGWVLGLLLSAAVGLGALLKAGAIAQPPPS
jgi:hypothetical protein